jgi:CheY-like chemotaxis protein
MYLPKKILHVDDDFALRELIRAVFSEIEGFELETAKNGLEAVEKMDTFQADLILLDLSMPGMDGAEFLKKKTEHPTLKDAPVIVITQFDNVTLQSVDDALGVIGVLHKPVDMKTLRNDINELWLSKERA